MLVADVQSLSAAIKEAIAAHPHGNDPNLVGPAMCAALYNYAYEFVTPETAHLWLEQVTTVLNSDAMQALAREAKA